MPDDFWLRHAGDLTQPELTDDMIRHAESALGVKLPQSLLNILRRMNGGCPKRTWFRFEPEHGSPYMRVLPVLYGIPDPAEPPTIRDTIIDRGFIDGWDLPNQLVILTVVHVDCVCLDYRDTSQPEPGVVYIDTQGIACRRESEELGGSMMLTRLAPSFAQFASQLIDAEPIYVFGLKMADEDLPQVAKVVGRALKLPLKEPKGKLWVGFPYRDVVYGAEHPKWKASIGNLPAVVGLCTNRDDDGYFDYPDFHRCNWTLRCDVERKHAPAFLSQLQSSGLDLTLIHAPPPDY